MYYMHPTTNCRGRAQREGMVLLIVIAMLALFASVALAFVFYAESQATGSQVTNGILTKTVPDGDPELLLTYFLNQLIYDTANYNSSVRGNSFMRTMYGSNPNALNASAFSGIGRLHYTQAGVLGGDDWYYYPNMQYYLSDGFTRDAEMYAGAYRAGNAPYTYPDVNNMFLAQVSANGEVIANSFHRPWLVQRLAGSGLPLAQQQQNLKYVIMYPDAVNYHNGLDAKGNPLLNSLGQPLGPFTVVGADEGGHVRNLDFSMGYKSQITPGTYANNDSYFLDLGYPVMIAPNGRKYKALFAPLIIDLDNRINMWLAGNYNGKPSHLGYGPNEINLTTVITNPADLTALYRMRYGAAGMPNYPALPTQWPQRTVSPFGDGPVNARIDFDGLNGGPLTLPNPNNANYGAPQYFIWPDYPNGTYGANPPWFTPPAAMGTTAVELLNHPLGYNPYNPALSGNNPIPPASQMEAILRYMGTGAPAVSSRLFKGMPNTFGNAASPYQTIRARNLLSTHSWTLDRISGAPYVPGTVAAGGAYVYNGATAPYPYPQMPPLNSPSFANPSPGGDFTASFSSALALRLRVNVNRITTGMYDYPTPDATGFIDTTQAAIANQFGIAQGARQALANDIYQVLVAVTGAQDPNLAAYAAVANTTPQFQAARWLAQLAVNIVDYIDNDDICTPFPWYTPPMGSANPLEIVYGTEAPRVVINEAYAELDNVATDFAGMANAGTWVAANYSLNVWAELCNPFKITPAGETYPLDGGVARLNVTPSNAMVNPYAAYQVQLAQFDPNLRAPANNTGATALGLGLPVTAWGPTPIVTPANGAFYGTVGSNTPGFYVIGPAAAWLPPTPIGTGMTPSNNPNLPMTFPSPQMSYSYKIGGAGDVTNAVLQNGTTILLQRLACPYLPPSPTNPYITVDYVQNVKTWDNRIASPTGVNMVTPPTGPTFLWYSVGRRQPYYASRQMPQQQYTTVAAASNGLALPQAIINVASTFGFPAAGNINVNVGGANQLITYTAITPTSFTGCTGGAGALATGQVVTPASAQPKNTFFRHNSAINVPPTAADPTLDFPFDWLVQLDRPVVNSLELMHVSGVRPHELTQQFIAYNAATNTTLKFQQYAPWLDHAAMIFRALELLGVPSNLNGATVGGRVPGKININTLNEPEVLMALCDPNGVSSFNGPYVLNTLLPSLIASRTPGFAGFNIPAGTPGPNDTPFRSFAAGWVQGPNPNGAPPVPPDPQYPQGAGLRDTLLRTALVNGNVQRLFQNTGVNHPYQQWEILQKIYNNITTTSNVFAIWVTVGFFEVQDTDTAGNPINPPKIGSELGRDQNMQIRHRMFAIVDRSAVTLFQTQLAGTGVTAGTGATATVNPGTGLLPNGNAWAIQPGMLLEIGVPGVASEVVAVTAANGNAFTANFTMSWPAGAPVVCRGNPGPYMTNASPVTALYNHRTDPAVLHYSIIQ